MTNLLVRDHQVAIVDVDEVAVVDVDEGVLEMLEMKNMSVRSSYCQVS